MSTRISIFIVPRSSTAWKGNEAGWITASGWAAAGKQLFGEALVGTRDGVFDPSESIHFPAKGKTTSNYSAQTKLRKFIPELFITAYKDYKLWNTLPAQWPIEDERLYQDKRVMMVWERHDLFPGPGRKLADKFNVPLIISAEAVVVWEARKWGIARPVWGNWLEKKIESKSLNRGDLIVCVSDEVRDRVVELGINPNKVRVVPNRVDTTYFHPNVNCAEVMETFQTSGKRIIGWIGSFRNFHGLDTVLDAFKMVVANYDDTRLMLVGDGIEYEKIKLRIQELGLSERVILTGRQPLVKVAEFIRTFYVGIVSAAQADGFHYSPLKLREYHAVGCATIAPAAGEVVKNFRDGVDLLFYETGNCDDLAAKIITLLNDTALRDRLVKRGIELTSSGGSWFYELKEIAKQFNISDE